MNSKSILTALASLKIAIVSFSLLFVLVLVGTLDQVNLGIFLVQKKYFQSFFVWQQFGDHLTLPIFPGGFLIGWVMIINLIAVFIVRKLYQIKKLGLMLIHSGIILLILGSGLTSYLGIESYMAIREGQTASYSEHRRYTELAIMNTAYSDSEDHVTVIPTDLLQEGVRLTDPALPFHILVHASYDNAQFIRRDPSMTPDTRVTHGAGKDLFVRPLPIFTQDDQMNFRTVLLTFFDPQTQEPLGSYLMSNGLKNPDILSVSGQDYTVRVRSRRYYNPYSITLTDFKHDVYAGTDIPKNFSSLVALQDQGSDTPRDYLIYMNHPLRYLGKTYYQASFGENDSLSVLQVVQNPGWLMPYLSCLLISLGLLIQFLQHLIVFSKRKRT